MNKILALKDQILSYQEKQFMMNQVNNLNCSTSLVWHYFDFFLIIGFKFLIVMTSNQTIKF